MRPRIAPPAGLAGPAQRGSHQFSQVMQRILRQTEVLLQRRLGYSPDGWTAEAQAPALDGLEVSESTWAEWTRATAKADAGQ